MVARVGTLAVGTLFDTLLTGRRGVVLSRPHGEYPVLAEFPASKSTRELHPDVRVRVVEVTH